MAIQDGILDIGGSISLHPEDYEYANPNAASLMQSLRAFGYDISTAIADLIDNSIFRFKF